MSENFLTLVAVIIGFPLSLAIVLMVIILVTSLGGLILKGKRDPSS